MSEEQKNSITLKRLNKLTKELNKLYRTKKHNTKKIKQINKRIE